jgi:hypothetical protein
MLKGWAEDESNTLSADEQFDRYLKFYNECFKVSALHPSFSSVPMSEFTPHVKRIVGCIHTQKMY